MLLLGLLVLLSCPCTPAPPECTKLLWVCRAAGRLSGCSSSSLAPRSWPWGRGSFPQHRAHSSPVRRGWALLLLCSPRDRQVWHLGVCAERDEFNHKHRPAEPKAPYLTLLGRVCKTHRADTISRAEVSLCLHNIF